MRVIIYLISIMFARKAKDYEHNYTMCILSAYKFICSDTNGASS